MSDEQPTDPGRGNDPRWAHLPRVVALSDPHLAHAVDKPMDQFGAEWVNHPEKIRRRWQATVSNDDIAVVPGDISWAMKPRDAEEDLRFLEELPFRRLVLVKGNHDLWWRSRGKTDRMTDDSTVVLEGTAEVIDGICFAGARAWVPPEDPYFAARAAKFQPIHEKEVRRLERALDQAERLKDDWEVLVVLLHHPPYTSDGKPTEYSRMIEDAGADHCVYGHLHYESEWEVAAKGERNGVIYHLSPCDAIDFTPVDVLVEEPRPRPFPYTDLDGNPMEVEPVENVGFED